MLQSDPPVGGAPTRELIVRAERVGHLPRPWIWTIYEGNCLDSLHRSSRTYRSAEDAWMVGNKMLVLLGLHRWRLPQSPMSRETKSFTKVGDKMTA